MPRVLVTLAAVGRVGALLSVIMIIQAVVFHTTDLAGVDDPDTPPFVLKIVWIGKYVFPVAAPLCLAASLGICFRKPWGKHLMTGLLGAASLGALVVGVMILREAWVAPPGKYENRGAFLIGGPVVLLAQVAVLALLTVFVATSEIETQ